MISPVIYEKLKAELAELEIERDSAAKQLEETASFMDLREEDSFHIAKAKYITISEMIQKKTAQLSEPVGLPIGNSIVAGKLLKITYLGMQSDSGETIEEANEEMILLFAEDGDPVIQGILSTESDLGRLINNGREGRYRVNVGRGSRYYDVRFFTGDTEEYFKLYPASKKKKIERLLRNEF